MFYLETYSLTKTARSWDSYKDTLIKVLKAFNPYCIFEYGPGESTKIMQEHPSVISIDTVEHNQAWGAKSKEAFNKKVFLQQEADEIKYPFVSGRVDKYDLIFIDGLKRIECLLLAKFRMPRNGIVILHDAERNAYIPAINTFEYKFFTDEGNTAVLTNDSKTAIKLSEVLW